MIQSAQLFGHYQTTTVDVTLSESMFQKPVRSMT